MDILFVDKDIVVCVKPVGLDAEHQLPEALKAELGGEIFTLHRLDMNVGGVMVYARTKTAAASLSTLITGLIPLVPGLPGIRCRIPAIPGIFSASTSRHTAHKHTACKHCCYYLLKLFPNFHTLFLTFLQTA